MIVYRFIKYLIMYIQYKRVLEKAYEDENVIENLTRSFESTFRKDWVGRLYTVFNPNLKNGEFDPSNPIYSYNIKGLNTDEFVKEYILTKLSVIDRYINAQNLFELVSYDIKKLDNYDNYLFVIKPLPFDNFIKYAKLLIIPITLVIGALTWYFCYWM